MDDSKKPDLKAPRFNRDIFNTTSPVELAKIKDEAELSRDYEISEIRSIIVSFNKTIYKKVIEYRDGVKLPQRLGNLFIGTCPAKKKSRNVDFKMSNEHEKIIQHRNWESDNYLAKIFYTSFDNMASFKFKELWRFKASRNFSRETAKEYPLKWNTYHRIDPFRQISAIFNEAEELISDTERTKSLLEVYDEFDF